MLRYYHFIPKRKWNEAGFKPEIRNYKPISPSRIDRSIQNSNAYVTKMRGWDMTAPTIFVIATHENGEEVLFAYGNTYSQSEKNNGLVDSDSIDYVVFKGPNQWAGEEWHIYENGYVTFNVMGSGRPIVESYLGKCYEIENPPV